MRPPPCLAPLHCPLPRCHPAPATSSFSGTHSWPRCLGCSQVRGQEVLLLLLPLTQCTHYLILSHSPLLQEAHCDCLGHVPMSSGLWIEFRWKGSLGVLPQPPSPPDNTSAAAAGAWGRCGGQGEGDTRSGLGCSLSLGGQPRRPRRGRESVCKQGSCQEGARVRCEGGGGPALTGSRTWDSASPTTHTRAHAHTRAGSRSEAHTRVQCLHTARCTPLSTLTRGHTVP